MSERVPKWNAPKVAERLPQVDLLTTTGIGAIGAPVLGLVTLFAGFAPGPDGHPHLHAHLLLILGLITAIVSIPPLLLAAAMAAWTKDYNDPNAATLAAWRDLPADTRDRTRPLAARVARAGRRATHRDRTALDEVVTAHRAMAEAMGMDAAAAALEEARVMRSLVAEQGALQQPLVTALPTAKTRA